MRSNPIQPLYAYLYVVDKYEGLVLINAATLLDGDPLNNYLQRVLDPSKYANSAFNPAEELELLQSLEPVVFCAPPTQYRLMAKHGMEGIRLPKLG